MNSEARLILEVWDSVRDFIPAAKREDVASLMLRSFEEYGFDPEDFADLVGEDKTLEEVYNLLYDTAEEDYYDEDYNDEYED